MSKYLAIALGGALGAIARYFVASLIASRLGSRFPYGTFIVNMTACVLIGFSLAYLNRKTEISLFWRFLVPVGFIGAYSTFSTFEWETFTFLETGAFVWSSFYVLASIFFGLAAVWGGVLLGRIIP